MSVTIKDIAIKAKISYPSVSRALSGKPGVSKKTREKVLKIARELNYQPNALARGLVQKRTLTIGLIIPDIINPYFPEIAKGVDDEAHNKGYNVFLCNSDWNEEREAGYINHLTEKRVDGIIIFPAAEENIDEVRRKAGSDLPLIILGSDQSCDGALSISIDNVLGAELSTSHLIDRGYRKLAFIGGEKGRAGVQSRLEGYRKAHKLHDLPVSEESIVLSGFTFESGYKVIEDLLDSGIKPDAVFAENDVVAMGVIQAVRAKGLSIPDDIAVSGFDDIPMASMYGIELTTVHQPKYEMGKLAVKQLLSLIDGDDLYKGSSRMILEPELVVRKTT